MLIWYWFPVRKVGIPVEGLVPAWSWLRRADTGADIRPYPVILPLGPGVFRFAYDAEASGDAVGQIDMGDSFVDGYERWQDVQMVRETGRILGLQAGTIQIAAG